MLLNIYIFNNIMSDKNLEELKNTYTIQELELIKNIDNLDLLSVLRNNKLSLKFCVNYILNEEYQTTRKERDITIDTVANYQPHLYEEIKKLLQQ
jgi:hypothetical protein